MAVVDIKAAVVKNANLMQKSVDSRKPKLLFYRSGIPILFDGMCFCC